MALIKTQGQRSWRKQRNWRHILNIISILSFIANIFWAYYNFNLTNQNLELNRENLRLQNFASIIIANADYAFFNSSDFSLSDSQFVQVGLYGYVRADLKIITPHYGKVSILLKYLHIGDWEYIDLGRRNEAKLSYAHEAYENVVVQGLNQINAKLHLRATVYLNPQNLPPQGQLVQFPLGELILEAMLFDLQNNNITTTEFSADMVALIEMPIQPS